MGRHECFSINVKLPTMKLNTFSDFSYKYEFVPNKGLFLSATEVNKLLWVFGIWSLLIMRCQMLSPCQFQWTFPPTSITTQRAPIPCNPAGCAPAQLFAQSTMTNPARTHPSVLTHLILYFLSTCRHSLKLTLGKLKQEAKILQAAVEEWVKYLVAMTQPLPNMNISIALPRSKAHRAGAQEAACWNITQHRCATQECTVPR